ncbi:MAG: hypothetical protein GF390_03590 [Candidatus Pacebacteria bacterium]|nr:hypothetical protein [Candidatus Paceibacterota bacterium]
MMKNLIAFFRSQSFVKIILIILFVISRTYIYLNPPEFYSDVTADYERYANTWRYGLTPYRMVLYEYPPATIPLLALPLEIDQLGIGNYYANYRFQIMVIDAVFFGLLLIVLPKLAWFDQQKYWPLLAYLGLTSLAKNFFYEGIDLAFAAAIIISFIVLLWSRTQTQNKKHAHQAFLLKVISWTFFWLSFAIKFLTFPLIIPLWLIHRSVNLKKDLAAVMTGCLVVWGLPLMLYRTSLGVSVVYNLRRPIKYASFPAYLIRWVDYFTNTETQIMKAPDFERVGPISTVVTNGLQIVFPLAILLILWWAVNLLVKKLVKKPLLKGVKHQLTHPAQTLKTYWQLFLGQDIKLKQVDQQNKLFYLLKIYGIYVFVLFLTAKIFSQPFHIWYLPLLVLFPFAKTRDWGLAVGAAVLMVALDTAEFLHLKNIFGPEPYFIDKELLSLIRDGFRFLPMLVMLKLLVSSSFANYQSSKS